MVILTQLNHLIDKKWTSEANKKMKTNWLKNIKMKINNWKKIWK